jgi:glyoxalase/bleomycin resistance protein/dioxygenase superfamily protein
MITNRSMPPGSVIPELAYADVPAAARWLCTAFGFRERLRIAAHRIQLVVGDGSVVVVEREANNQPSSRVMVRVSDVDAHYMTAVGAGAQIISKPTTYPFGSGSILRWISAGIGGHFHSPSPMWTRPHGVASWLENHHRLWRNKALQQTAIMRFSFMSQSFCNMVGFDRCVLAKCDK